MEALKAEILSQIPSYTPENYEWHGIEEFASLVYEKNGYTVYGDAIQAALDKYAKNVRLNMTEAPVIEFFGYPNSAVLMAEMAKFLKFALTFTSL